jgi:hypothetical protein
VLATDGGAAPLEPQKERNRAPGLRLAQMDPEYPPAPQGGGQRRGQCRVGVGVGSSSSEVEAEAEAEAVRHLVFRV